jgi:transcriptional regulator with XRE-family HTH domain
MSIGFKLKKLRETRNLTQENLANKLDISQAKLSDIENGRRKKEIDFELVTKICQELKVELDFFITKETKPNIRQNNSIHFDILEKLQILIEDNLAKEKKINELEKQLHNRNNI